MAKGILLPELKPRAN